MGIPNQTDVAAVRSRPAFHPFFSRQSTREERMKTMSENSKSKHARTANSEEQNKRYVMRDATGRRHVLIAGENGVTEEWIARLRHDENVLRSVNFRYYHRWNGHEYVPILLRYDLVDPDVLERYPSMAAALPDAESLLIEREERELFLRKFRAAMRSLTESQLRLIRQRYEQGLSDVEIARLEGVDPTAIRNRWKKIRRKIKKYFA